MLSKKMRIVKWMDFSKNTFLVAALGTLVLFNASWVSAQIAAPEVMQRDGNGVNLMTGMPTFEVKDVGIGAGDMTLSHSIASYGGEIPEHTGPLDQYVGYYRSIPARDPYPAMYEVVYGPNTMNFYAASDLTKGQIKGTSITHNGATLDTSNPLQIICTTSDGTKIFIDTTLQNWANNTSTLGTGVVTRVETPAGLVTTIYYKTVNVVGFKESRIQSVVQNNGLQLKYSYSVQTLSDNPLLVDKYKWRIPTSVVALNNAYEYCDPTADTCTYTQNWPKATYTWAGLPNSWPTAVDSRCFASTTDLPPFITGYVFTVTDQGGVKKAFTNDPSTISTINMDPVCPQHLVTRIDTDAGVPTTYTYIRFTGGGGVNYTSGTPVLSPTFDRGYVATNVTRGNAAWTYTYQYNPAGCLGGFSGVVSGPTGGMNAIGGGCYTRILNASDSSKTVRYNDDFVGQVNSIDYFTNGGTGYTKTFTFDDRGNITHTVSTSAATPGIIEESADYDLSCTIPNKCNKPNWVKDPNGNVTNFAYYSTAPIGFLKSLTKPVGINGSAPQTRYEYAQYTAQYKNASGSFVSGSPIWLLSKESTCTSGNSCAPGSPEEVVTTYEYGPITGPNNLFLRGVVKTASDGTQIKSLRTCYGYDMYGHKISETAPKAHLTSCP